ncbi:hypothetical protein M2281_000161 [Mesorhizobium soli]|uniref:hypothetical protein n=1 Tax=Pseudaminobacter soli (ex Li et al. 2025) TaxID=1295366 RepID=UPI002476743F|nr:hypothetical protein [Mesorhizobium soli]MDH6229589.1 hypothetical protein [Mesorhizobium soli]
MTLGQILEALGINGSVVVAGLSGGILRALSRKKLKVREVILSPICGALAAAYLTLPMVHYLKAVGWPLPAEDAQVILASAFLIGTCAMWISDIVFGVVARRFKMQPPSDHTIDTLMK